MDLWAIVGRLAVIVTILTALAKFISWRRSPKEKLRANVSPSPFVLPPAIETEFSAGAENVRQAINTFLEEHPKKADGYDEAYYRGHDMADTVKRALKHELSYKNRSFQGCWHARVENFGKIKCSGVNLHLPHAILARVQRDSDREATITDVQGLITIGELRPKGHCYVTAWTDQRVASRDNYDVVLDHDSGIGRVIGKWQTTRLGWIIGTLIQRENILSFLPLLFVAIAVLWYVALGLLPVLSKKPHINDANSQPRATPPPAQSPSANPSP